jgi:hypothetical protein
MPSRPTFFVSEKDAPFTLAGLSKLIERAGVAAKIGFKVHPPTLRRRSRAPLNRCSKA